MGGRCGFTTGTCAAAAAGAASHILLTGEEIQSVEVTLPGGSVAILDLVYISYESSEGQRFVTCSVRKDAGDDPDITDGMLVCAKARLTETPGVEITGGEGIGRVTRKGLDRPVGDHAINTVPRKMITSTVMEECKKAEYGGGVYITLSIPGGREAALKTFNPRLGIEGGLSVLGTTGIVRPMSSEALIKTIEAFVSVREAEGHRVIALVPGNYGREFMMEKYGFDPDIAVPIGNYVGDALDISCSHGFKHVLFAGHIGKLVKVAAGKMNTHSSKGDLRMETIAAVAKENGAGKDIVSEIESCVSSEEACVILKEAGQLKSTADSIVSRIQENCQSRNGQKVEVIIFSKECGLLSATEKAEEYIKWCISQERDRETGNS